MRFSEEAQGVDRYVWVPVEHHLPPGPATDRVLQICAGTPYQPLRLLKRGGMGQIYVVQHRQLEIPFALKVLHRHVADVPSLADRMRIEAQAMARLGHPHIVKVIDFWTDDRSPCFVMELLNGRDLYEEITERRQIPATEVMAWGCQVLRALSAAHEIGIIHRDIKPENLFLHQAAGSSKVLKVLDFGVARVIEDVSNLTPRPLTCATRSGARLGSPRFMSPEGRLGQRVDQRGDIYSLGLTLYVALVGSSPFDVGPVEVVPPPSQAGAATAFPALDAIVLRAMERNPEARYSSAKEFLIDLSRLAPQERYRGSWQIRRQP